ncbi:hypothetical protein Q5741_18770 [Paenibacillus sp. JX-17]|uniref:Uncharacterized protein n=1 Tax=Paenibacillus lacisoli TaxID=3064525 RepID=A0ABT9CGP2_9BACL|nr:hypothetical protein [Paenibacillus sp. JX-17]MDO7908448.1 hypothetical protein [Paenibacillus sp. JX-17]
MKYDKEEIYDNEIAPLMKQIIEICKREQLPMTAQFYLKEQAEDTGDPMYCSTVIVPAKSEMNDEAYEQMKFVSEAMKYGPGGKPFVMSAMIRTV